MTKNIGLYIHIPFCHKLCTYCDFVKRVSTPDRIQKYVDYLIKEINIYQNNDFDFSKVDSIYIGGGTPSLLNKTNPNQLDELLSFLDQLIDKYQIKLKEYSIEINPEDLDQSLVELFKKHQINRVSIGIQTLSNKLGLIIGREINFDLFKSNFKYLKSQIPNVNIDLMYAIPTQTIKDIEDTVSKVLDLEPTHLSIYSLILEKNTKLNYLYESGKISLISEDEELQMIDKIHKLLFPRFYQYEVSNYALKSTINYESYHNKKYWLNEEYLGVGLGASSYINNVRFKNFESLKDYYDMIDQGILQYLEYDELKLKDKKEYTLILGLRMLQGIDLKKYQEDYNSSLFDDFNNRKIQEFIDKNYLIYQDDFLRINPKYLYIMDYLIKEVM